MSNLSVGRKMVACRFSFNVYKRFFHFCHVLTLFSVLLFLAERFYMIKI